MTLHAGVVAVAVLVGTMCAGATPAAAADEAPRLGLTPTGQRAAYFELTLDPGDRKDLEVEAANFGRRVVAARTYAADVYSIVNGGFGAELYGRKATGPTAWLSYATREVILGPGEAITLPFAVTVPAGTPSGQYIAALVIENVEPLRGEGRPITVDQVTRSAIAVAIDVPGPRHPELGIGAVGHSSIAGHSIVTFEVANPGNVHLEPSGAFRVVDARGAEIASGPVVMDTVYAGDATLVELPLAGLLPSGGYCAELSLADPGTGARDSVECRKRAVTFSTVSPGRSVPANPAATGDPAATSVVLPSIVGGSLLGVLLLLIARRRARQRSSGRVVRGWEAGG